MEQRAKRGDHPLGQSMMLVEKRLAQVPDLMTELHRLDIEFWGNIRTGAVFRCVAAANWRDGRPGKLSGIAATLNFGVATVHSHLAVLKDCQDPVTGKQLPLVGRVTGGYSLTPAGDTRMREWAAAAVAIVWRYCPVTGAESEGEGEGALKSSLPPSLHWAMAPPRLDAD